MGPHVRLPVTYLYTSVPRVQATMVSYLDLVWVSVEPGILLSLIKPLTTALNFNQIAICRKSPPNHTAHDPSKMALHWFFSGGGGRDNEMDLDQVPSLWWN